MYRRWSKIKQRLHSNTKAFRNISYSRRDTALERQHSGRHPASSTSRVHLGLSSWALAGGASLSSEMQICQPPKQRALALRQILINCRCSCMDGESVTEALRQGWRIKAVCKHEADLKQPQLRLREAATKLLVHFILVLVYLFCYKSLNPANDYSPLHCY